MPTEGVEKARENMLPISNDKRVPMMDIYEMYRGKKTPDDVLAAAKAGEPPPEKLKTQLFYANLYVGLYYESLGKDKEAQPHILDAANKYRGAIPSPTWATSLAFTPSGSVRTGVARVDPIQALE